MTIFAVLVSVIVECGMIPAAGVKELETCTVIVAPAVNADGFADVVTVTLKPPGERLWTYV
jgi:hypothetical protein